MTSLLKPLSLCLCLLQITVAGGDFVDVRSNKPLLSLADEETVLPCRYQPGKDNKVVQVTWYKKTDDADKEQIITADNTNAQTAFGSWSRRVRFRGPEPTADASLVITNTEISDEGTYICHISTFPLGNFDAEISLTVQTSPISSLDPVVVVEGQSHRPVASCHSVARPPPRLTWDTELNGQSVSRSADSRTVSIKFSLHPLRSMNGKKLDCLVWHPAFPTPRRLRNNLVVHYPPDAEVSGYNGEWFAGLNNAALTCVSGGNPKPHNFTWIRVGGELPNGTVLHPNGTLAFGHPLLSSDEGTYRCLAENEVGKATAEVKISLTAPPRQSKEFENTFLVAGVAAGVLILMLVIVIAIVCRHKRKNKKLKRELNEKKEEISTLSRQASFRRVNSLSTDARLTIDESIPLKVDGTLRNSFSSLGEQTRCRDSRSTISGGRGGVGAFDSLGRPSLYNNSRRGRERILDRDEDNRLRVEAYVRNTISLQENCFHPPLMPTTFPMVQATEIMRQRNGSAIIPSDGGSRQGSVVKNNQHPPVSGQYPQVTDDEDEVDEGLGGPASQEHPDDQDSETNSFPLSEEHSAVLSHMRTSPPMRLPHASFIHKAQIV
ncbi:nectin-4 [Cololabis saira]|uniref:nectin-4 n=1 Tax=Cololabis saira TaxID=129043 RepID=UPI002AD23DF7|nr:nectin-4 [Cololabis saira]